MLVICWLFYSSEWRCTEPQTLNSYSYSCLVAVRRVRVLGHVAALFRTSPSHLFLDFPACLLPAKRLSRICSVICCQTSLLHVQPTLIFTLPDQCFHTVSKVLQYAVVSRRHYLASIQIFSELLFSESRRPFCSTLGRRLCFARAQNSWSEEEPCRLCWCIL